MPEGMKSLRALREKLRVKQIELAKSAGLSPSRLSIIEKGWAPMTDNIFEKIKAGYQSLGFTKVESYLCDVLKCRTAQKNNR